MFERIGDTRRARLDRENPDQLRSSIAQALDELQGYSGLQEHMGAQSINPVEKLLLEIADAASDLARLGEEPPTVDLAGVCDDFLCALPDHPVWNRIEQIREQQALKAALLAKWGRSEQWRKRGISETRVARKC